MYISAYLSDISFTFPLSWRRYKLRYPYVPRSLFLVVILSKHIKTFQNEIKNCKYNIFLINKKLFCLNLFFNLTSFAWTSYQTASQVCNFILVICVVVAVKPICNERISLLLLLAPFYISSSKICRLLRLWIGWCWATFWNTLINLILGF